MGPLEPLANHRLLFDVGTSLILISEILNHPYGCSLFNIEEEAFKKKCFGFCQRQMCSTCHLQMICQHGMQAQEDGHALNH